VSATPVPCAASSLLLGLLADSGSSLVETARTRVSVHYETGRADVPVLSVCSPEAVRLPAALVTTVLPAGPVEPTTGGLRGAESSWRVTRWWQPPRPRGLQCPSRPPEVPGVEPLHSLDPRALLGRGPGLTPEGDDVLAGALVAARATADPRLACWQAQTREALAARRTTVVSRALLHHALAGYATPELADFLAAVCGGRPAGAATRRLLAVGHTSGAAVAAGALHVLTTGAERAAA
jgi:hypothetical protein